MHELSIAQNILDIVRDNVPVEDRAAVRDIRLRIGPYAGIVVESLMFGFSVLAAESEMPGASLAVEATPIILACDICGTTGAVECGVYACPSCGGTEIRFVSGHELQLVDIVLLTLEPETA